MARPKKTKDKASAPKVSVLLTSYNHANYISAAIESVLNQTFTDFELLIVDDGSTDDSREIIKNFNDPRIKFFLYEENRGSVIAIADAEKSARGKYIAVHHSDDTWSPDKLEKQIAFLDSNKNFAACFTWVDFIDAQGNLQKLDDNDFYKKIFEQENRPRAQWLNYFFYNANCLCHPSAVIRRDFVEKFHLHATHGFWQLPDYLTWIWLCFHGEIFILPERLTQFRLRRERQENVSATTFDKIVRGELEFFFVAKEFLENFADDKFFLEVFPETKKFLVGGQFNRRFAFAQLCLEKESIATNSFQLVGLEILKNLLNNPTTATQIKKLYDYNEKTFRRDGGSFDIFNLEWKIPVLRAEIFVGNDENFSLAAKKVISVDTNGKFYAKIDFDIENPAKFLRFDPDTGFISVKINRVLINGLEAKISCENSGEIVNGFYRFKTNDPQIIFSAENLSGHVIFEIFGEREENYSEILTKNFAEMTEKNNQLAAQFEQLHEQKQSLVAQNEDLHTQNKNLREYNQELQTQIQNFNTQIENLNTQNKNLREYNQELQTQIENLNAQKKNLQQEKKHLEQVNHSILNSNSWKITKPLRSIGNFFR